MPENAKVEVALEKKDVGAGGIDNATIKEDACLLYTSIKSILFNISICPSYVDTK